MFLASSLSLTCSAMMSCAPCMASSILATPFSLQTNSFAFLFTSAAGFCNIRKVANGSNPFCRATSARVFLLGLNGRYISSNSVLSQEPSTRDFNSGVSLPCSSMVFRMVSLRFANSFNFSNWSLTLATCTSSRAPVTSFRYRLMNGMVHPSSKSPTVPATCRSLMPVAFDMSFVKIVFMMQR